MRPLVAAAFIASLLFALGAKATDDDPLIHPQEDHRVSVTIAPLTLALMETGELATEYDISHTASITGLIGYGRPSGSNLWEVGLQGRFYLLGHFDNGLDLGLQAMYLDGPSISGALLSTSPGLNLGIFLGYKFVFHFGLTFDVQAGYQLFGVGGVANDGLAANVSAPLLRTNIGWSF